MDASQLVLHQEVTNGWEDLRDKAIIPSFMIHDTLMNKYEISARAIGGQLRVGGAVIVRINRNQECISFSYVVKETAPEYLRGIFDHHHINRIRKMTFRPHRQHPFKFKVLFLTEERMSPLRLDAVCRKLHYQYSNFWHLYPPERDVPVLKVMATLYCPVMLCFWSHEPSPGIGKRQILPHSPYLGTKNPGQQDMDEYIPVSQSVSSYRSVTLTVPIFFFHSRNSSTQDLCLELWRQSFF